MKKSYNVNEIKKIMRQNGYIVDRTTGSHIIYKKGSDTISLPINKGSNKRICKYTINSEFKKHNIIIQ